MHALNNLVGGPYVTQDACRRAAQSVVRALSAAGMGDAEDAAHHLDNESGFLSLDVINVLGAGALGIQVEGDAVSWAAFQVAPRAAALVNCNNCHWTVLQRMAGDGGWLHTNSVLGPAPRHGRRHCPRPIDVDTIFDDLQLAYGAVTLHRIIFNVHGAGHHFLESQGMRAMEGADDEATEEVGGGTDARQAPALEERDSRAPTVSLVTHNVDGLGDYPGSAADRMEAILTVLLQAAPDMILLQEVTMAMHAVVRRRLAGWKIYRLRRLEEDYFNVTAVRASLGAADVKATTFSFPGSENGRHVITVWRGAWAISNTHAESGGRSAERNVRAAQLQHLSRSHEASGGLACILAGDLNVREGEDHCLLVEGWRDCFNEAPRVAGDSSRAWTWKRGAHSARYDRVYIHGGSVKCERLHVIHGLWNALSDHVALHAVLREEVQLAVGAPDVELEPPPSGRLAVDIASRDSPQGDAPPDRLSRREGATQHTRTSPAVGMTWRSGASSSFAGMQPRRPIRVVDISNLVTQAVQQFKLLAVACLDQMSALDRVEVGPEDTLVAWADVPRACSFQIARPGGRGHQRHISAEEKLEQQRVYTAHQLWAATCGVDALAWRELVQQAGSLQRKRLGSEGLPPCLRPAGPHCTTHRQHAILMCRVAGLVRAAKEAGRVLGGDVCAASAGDEMTALLEVTRDSLQGRCEALPTSWRHQCARLASDWAWEGGNYTRGLFELWLRAEGARRMEQAAQWERMSDAAVERRSKSQVPTVITLDGASLHIGIPGHLDSHKVADRGKAPILGDWWLFSWEAACEEVRLRHGARGHVVLKECGATWTMLELYKRMHCVPGDPEDQLRRDEELLALHRSLQLLQHLDATGFGRFRRNAEQKLFDAKTIACLWDHTEAAVRSGKWAAWRLACEPMARRHCWALC